MEGLKPAGGMILVQVVFAGVNIFYKLAINDGMDMKVLVAYRYLFATAILGPFAFFIERKRRPSMTWKIIIQAFLCGLFGGTLAQNLYVTSIKLTSATFASAMTNLIPAITFVMAVMFRLENLGIHSVAGQAKVAGTLVGIGGAMLLTFYKGAELNFWPSKLNLIRSDHSNGRSNVGTPHQESGSRVMGSLLALASCFSYAIWLIIQAKMSQVYPCIYSTTALMCFMGSIQATVFALSMEREWTQWRMSLGIRLVSVIYSGIVASALILTVLAWCIKKKGPLYASVFNPLMLVIVALLGSLLLNEKLHVGSIIGAVLIVIGLYFVLWGKGRETKKMRDMHDLISNEPINVVVVPEETTKLEESRNLQEPKDKVRTIELEYKEDHDKF